ncbi:MAG TPA: NAD+ synthase [Candidatus Limnocylindria bacterium]|nr:NAD+ synthase [Candidatus Limnocylindria bacterium]
MAQLRLALGQLNPTVGAIADNIALALDAARTAARGGADVLLLPEMHLTGYPIEDLALRPSFIEASRAAVTDLATSLVGDGLGDLTVVVGFLDRVPDAADAIGRPRGAPQNAVAVLHGGRVVARYAKHHLPNYGVFDEFRYFVPGTDTCVVRVRGVDVALAICEDLWQDGGPVAEYAELRPGLLLVANGSPYERNKDDVRLALVRRRAAEAGCTLAYLNMVGGQDELVFDGDSLVVTAHGEVLARAPQFVGGVTLVDLELPAADPEASGDALISAGVKEPYEPLVAPVAERISDEAEVYGALVVGVRDYARKNGFTGVVFGFSGGIDSSLSAAIAADALGGQNVYGVSMPSEYSSEHSKTDAADLARRLGCHYRVVPIEAMVRAFVEGLGLTGLAEENVQARVRGTIVMGISNSEGQLVLANGNKSELSVGYSTIYGDAVGGFAPLKDVPKTLVWELARWRNAEAERRGETPPIPVSSIDKPPSAELRPGQLDTDSLPDYALLDDVLDDYVESDHGAARLVAGGFDRALVERVLRMTDTAEWKRRQYPPGPKVSLRSFGRDRRLPITNRWRETL